MYKRGKCEANQLFLQFVSARIDHISNWTTSALLKSTAGLNSVTLSQATTLLPFVFCGTIAVRSHVTRRQFRKCKADYEAQLQAVSNGMINRNYKL